MQEGLHPQVLSFMKTRQILRLSAHFDTLPVPLKRYSFLRINSRNQQFIYLQSLDNFKFDNYKDLIE